MLDGKIPTGYVHCASHLSEIIPHQKREETVAWCIKTIREAMKRGLRFQAIAVSGVSGLTIGSILAYELGVNLIVVRKKEEKAYTTTHSGYEVEGCCDDSYIIVDDLICSGDTVKYVIRQIYEKLCMHAKCVGIFEHFCGRGFMEQTMLNYKIGDALNDTIQA